MMTGQQLSRFDIAELVSETPKVFLAKTSTFSGITRKFFNEYFEGRKLAHAFKWRQFNVMALLSNCAPFFAVVLRRSPFVI